MLYLVIFVGEYLGGYFCLGILLNWILFFFFIFIYGNLDSVFLREVGSVFFFLLFCKFFFLDILVLFWFFEVFVLLEVFFNFWFCVLLILEIKFVIEYIFLFRGCSLFNNFGVMKLFRDIYFLYLKLKKNSMVLFIGKKIYI